jgi:hypothetical protein
VALNELDRRLEELRHRLQQDIKRSIDKLLREKVYRRLKVAVDDMWLDVEESVEEELLPSQAKGQSDLLTWTNLLWITPPKAIADMRQEIFQAMFGQTHHTY